LQTHRIMIVRLLSQLLEKFVVPLTPKGTKLP